MKKSVMLCLILFSVGCSRSNNEPAEQALLLMNGAISSGRVDVFLEQLAPSTLKDVGARLGFGQEANPDRLMKRLVLAPGIASEKIRPFRPKLIRDRSGPSERWYRIDLGGQKLQVPVRKFGDRWRVALHEALIDVGNKQDD